MFVVPLKFMCSTQCDTPVRPGRSSLEPTLYQHQTDASGAVWISWTRTVRPLSSITWRTGSVDGSAGTWVAMARLYEREPSSPEVDTGRNRIFMAEICNSSVYGRGHAFAESRSSTQEGSRLDTWQQEGYR